jgi:hypothetical protein
MRIPPRLSFAFAVAAIASVPKAVSAQGIQALRGVGEAAKQAAIDSTARIVEKRLPEYMVSSVNSDLTPATNVSAARAVAAGQTLLLAREDPDRFKELVPAFLAADRDVRVTRLLELNSLAQNRSPNAPSVAAALTEARNAALGTLPIPAIFTLVPQVAFTASYGGSVVSSRFASGLGFNTNMVGAAIGSAFDALGSGALKEYFTNNVAVGASVPTSGGGKVSSDLGLGLGGVRIGAWAFWPVLGLGELDSADTRLPSELLQRKPAAATWSQLTFGVGVPFGGVNSAIRRMRCGKLAPVFSVGIRLPYYFPGNAYSGIAAVFTSRRNEYEKIGGASFLIGVDVPLLKVGSEPTGDAAAICDGSGTPKRGR